MATPIKQYEIRDFSGGLFRPSARHLSAMQIPENASPDVSNMWARSLGLEKRPVFKSWTDEALGKVYGLKLLPLSDGTRRHIAFAMDETGMAANVLQQSAYSDTMNYGGGEWEPLDDVSGSLAALSLATVEAAAYRDIFIFTNGKDAAQKIDPVQANSIDVSGITVSGENPNLNGRYVLGGRASDNSIIYLHVDDMEDGKGVSTDGARLVKIDLFGMLFAYRWQIFVRESGVDESYYYHPENAYSEAVGYEPPPKASVVSGEYEPSVAAEGKYSGTATVAFAYARVDDLGGDPPRGRYIAVKDNRIFMAGMFGDESRVRYSELGDPEDWPVENFINVNVSDGDQITGLVEFGGNLYIFKNRSIYRLSGSDPADFYLVQVVPDIGAVGQRAIVSTGGGMYFVSTDGVFYFDGGGQPRNITAVLDSYFRSGEIDDADMGDAACAWFGNALYVSLPINSSDISGLWVYDALTGGWWPWSSQEQDDVPLLRPTVFMKSLDTDGAEALYFDAPQLTEEVADAYHVCSFKPYGTQDAGAVTPVASWQSKDFDLGNPAVFKRFRRLRITGSSRQNVTANVYYAVDGKQTFTLAGVVNLYEANDNISQVKVNLPAAAQGKTLRLKLESTTAQELRIESVIVEYQSVGVNR